jgi:tyrosyl-tRNA synthetase
LVSDPTGQNKTRPMLTQEQIKQNAETYFQPAGNSRKMPCRRNRSMLSCRFSKASTAPRKMSKSKGNYIGLTEKPDDMFGKTMSISDELTARWYRLLFHDQPTGHPMMPKKELARRIVAQYHGDAAA